MTRTKHLTVGTMVATTLSLLLAWGTVSAGCLSGGNLSEATYPEAILGIQSTDPGFTARFWEWGNWANARGGASQPVVFDTDQGLALLDVNWANAEVCSDGSTTPRTIVVLEKLGADGGGWYAVVNLADNVGTNVDIDRSQADLGEAESVARPIPVPEPVSVEGTDDGVRVHLTWTVDFAAEALSDLADTDGTPLSSLTGFSIWVGADHVQGGDPSGWVRVADTEADAIGGHSRDLSATVLLPLDTWGGRVVHFALGLVFDGTGDPTDPASGSVASRYISAASPAVILPSPDSPGSPVIQKLRVAVFADGRILGVVRSTNEPDGSSYHVMVMAPGLQREVASFPANGSGRYRFRAKAPEISGLERVTVRVEMQVSGVPVAWAERTVKVKR